MALLVLMIEVNNADPRLEDPEEVASDLLTPDLRFARARLVSAHWGGREGVG